MIHWKIEIELEYDDRYNSRYAYMIPPALAEIGQLMFECVLQQLKHDANDSAEPPVANDQRL